MFTPNKVPLAVLLPTLCLQSNTVFANTLEDAFSGGTASVNMRYRFESVDDSVNTDASASTLRTRLGFTTSDKLDISAHADFEHVTRAGPPDYNSTQNGQTTYAKVVDPMVAQLNQAYLKYTGFEGSDITFGRQRIILDNARFVGNVGWRQNEQTFDALRFNGNYAKDFFVTYANIQKVNTITDAGIYSNHNLLNFGIKNLGGGKLTAYAYLLDYDANAAASTSTLGARYKGSIDNFIYTVEYAQQSDNADNPNSFSAPYLFGEFGYKFSDKLKLFLAYESLGSDAGNFAFQTPLATKHAFNGWADKFLATPATGLNDAYIKAVGKAAGVKLVGVYHEFSADEGSADYGSELDLVAIKKFNKTFSGLIKYADYSADTFSQDTSKFWLQLVMNLK